MISPFPCVKAPLPDSLELDVEYDSHSCLTVTNSLEFELR